MTFIDQYGLVPYKPWQLSRYAREGACEICGATADDVAARYAEEGYRSAPASALLNFDHCHAHGWIRGRLCSACNTEMATAVRLGRVDRHRRQEAYRAHLGKCPDCLTA